MRRSGTVYLLFAFVLLASSCSPASTRNTATTEVQTGGESSKADTSPEPSTCPPATGGTEGAFDQFIDLRVAGGENSDRVTFEFRGEAETTPPQFEIAVTTPPFTQGPTDNPLEIKGAVFVRIIFHGASGVEISSSGVEEFYVGPTKLNPDLEILEAAAQESDFEATLSWVFGLRKSTCWEITELEDPPRVVVDLPH